MPSLTSACLAAAALAYNVSVPTLEAIQKVEGGQVGQEVCGNFDGSCDLGPFQVNDHAWVNTLASSLHATPTKVRATLRDDGCWNARVASWILREELDETGDRLPAAIGNYHSHYFGEHMAYRHKVAQAASGLLMAGATPPPLPDSDDAALEALRGAATGLPGLPGGGTAAEAPKGKLITVRPAAGEAKPGADTGSAAQRGPVIYRGSGGP